MIAVRQDLFLAQAHAQPYAAVADCRLITGMNVQSQASGGVANVSPLLSAPSPNARQYQSPRWSSQNSLSPH